MQWVTEAVNMFGVGETWVDVVSWICRLITAVILGGIIGFEREHSHRPAGFRTHILVSVGSALIMMTAIYISKHVEGEIDLSRMSAQVVSGVGFLGAGTILREGFTVKGLTTAASVWAVSCVGIAVGTGFYSGAIAATVIIYITLNSLKKVVVKGKAGKVIYVEVKHLAQKVPEISKLVKRAGASIHSMEILDESDMKRSKKKETSTIKIIVFPKSEESLDLIVSTLRSDENIIDVYVD